MGMQRKLRPGARPILYGLTILAGALAAPFALGQGIGLQTWGLGRDPLDEIVGRAFACLNQHGKKRHEKTGRPVPCGAESALLRHLKGEHAAGTDIVSYLQQRRGTCEPAGAGKGCRVVREVTRRYYVDDQVQSTARTTFTVDIELNSDGEPARVSIDRYDLYGSEHDL